MGYKLLPELEDTYCYRLCIHHRHFLAGCFIVDNIDEAIRNSRKVLVVLSTNSVQSAWCTEEVEMTKSIDRTKLVVVLHEQIHATDVGVPPTFQHLLERHTYAEWNSNKTAQKLFWKKIRKALQS